MARGRPRKLDTDIVLDTALRLFWKNGYDATSMNDISAVTGMAKPGLYASFGNKDALYSMALDRYVNGFNDELAALATSEKPVQQAVREFLEAVAHAATDEAGPCGCFLANTLVQTSGKPSGITDMSRRLNERRNQAFAERFKRASQRGELAEGANPGDLAAFFSAQALALALMASSGLLHSDLMPVIDTAMGVLPPQRGTATV